MRAVSTRGHEIVGWEDRIEGTYTEVRMEGGALLRRQLS
jgi:hypothetical protein